MDVRGKGLGLLHLTDAQEHGFMVHNLTDAQKHGFLVRDNSEWRPHSSMYMLDTQALLTLTNLIDAVQPGIATAGEIVVPDDHVLHPFWRELTAVMKSIARIDQAMEDDSPITVATADAFLMGQPCRIYEKLSERVMHEYWETRVEFDYRIMDREVPPEIMRLQELAEIEAQNETPRAYHDGMAGIVSATSPDRIKYLLRELVEWIAYAKTL